MFDLNSLMLAFGICFVGAFVLTYFMRRYALTKGIMDCPNARSSHEIPTPRGGGVALVVVSLLTLLTLGTSEVSLWFMALGCGLVAYTGFIDDRQDVSPKTRLLTHFLAATIVVAAAGGIPPLTFFGVNIDLGGFGFLLTIVAVVWILNLYNFMDGINGIASMEAVTTMLPMFFLLGTFAGFELPLGQVHLLIAASVLGFLLWNFPSARIFMGDAGSGFLGIVIASLMVLTAQIGEEWLWAWLIMLGAFVVDATFTLLRRILARKQIFEAHRTHGFQWASRIHNSHTKVTVAFALINLLWLFPMAYLVVNDRLEGFTGLLIAYLPLVVLGWVYKCGVSEDEIRSSKYY
ncbi:MraY family glycosyltransferase [Aliidiomarina sp. Khilg15.8]